MLAKTGVADYLVLAKGLIQDRNNWIVGCSARDKNGIAVNPFDKSAVQFCLMGAVQHTLGNSMPKLISETLSCLHLAARRLDFNCHSEPLDPVGVNDMIGHHAVMELCDKAIEIAREKGN